MLIYAAVSKPKPIQRDANAQADVNTACKDLTLYHYTTCPFCIKVRNEIHRLALPIAMQNVLKDESARKALEQGGGRVKVPCLRIQNADGGEQWMYESDDIKHYLQQRFEH